MREDPSLLNKSDPDGPISGSFASSVLLSFLLALAYLGFGMLAFSMAVQDANVTCLAFFSEGVSLVAVIVFGPRVAPGIFLGQFVLAQWTGLPPSASAVIALVNTLQGILGGFLFWRCQISRGLNRPRDIALLFALTALILQPISATGGILAQYWLAGLPSARFIEVWLYWWAGNTLGQFLVLPLILSWTSHSGSRHSKREILRALVVAGSYFVFLAFFLLGDSQENASVVRLVFFAGFYLALIGIAVQSRVRTVSLANLLMTGPFLWMINTGPDLLSFFSNQNKLLCADIFIMAGILTSLLISALLEQLTDSQNRLRESNAAKEKLFSVIGHDLRSPIANLSSVLDLMSSGVLKDDDFHELQRDLRKGTNQALQTLDNLTEWGGFQMASSLPRFVEVPLYQSAEEAVQLLMLIASSKKIAIENRIPKAACVSADLHQTQSIIRNLLSNALKFTHERGLILISAEQEGAYWRVTIRDNGIGMAPERAARLFKEESGYISTYGTAQERGLGLGLQICLDFVRANGGMIFADSHIGVGTTVCFTLPIFRTDSHGNLSIADLAAPNSQM